jgi:antitoxin component YwqK of YwqJK toxin-antitoxin module
MTKPPKDGLHVEYYENGQKKAEGHFKNGKQDGLTTFWYENGQKQEELNWKNGELDGLRTKWHDNGQKKEESHWKNGEQDGLYTGWYENGQMQEEGHFKDGKREGLLTFWNENGQVRESRSTKGVLGFDTEWYENGQKKSEVHRRNYSMVRMTRWDENGEIVSQTSYSHGIDASYIPSRFLELPYNVTMICVFLLALANLYSSWFGTGELAKKIDSGGDCGILMSLASLLFIALMLYTAIALAVDKAYSGLSFYDWLKGYSNYFMPVFGVTDASIIMCFFIGPLIALVLFFVFGFSLVATAFKTIFFCGFFCLCFLPTFIAIKKDHPQFVPLAIVNFFFGATVIGWVGCLAWAFWKFDKTGSDLRS